VRIDPDTGRADVSVIGGGRPMGLCGSGVIDLLAELWSAGFLDSSGRFDSSRSRDRVRGSDDSSRNAVYTVVDACDSASGEEIVLDERDIQSLLRPKAAVYGACSFMLKSIGLELGAVKRVYVAGGFGRFLDLEKSITIGLLPDLPVESFTYLGNSALAGAHAIGWIPELLREHLELGDPTLIVRRQPGQDPRLQGVGDELVAREMHLLQAADLGDLVGDGPGHLVVLGALGHDDLPAPVRLLLVGGHRAV